MDAHQYRRSAVAVAEVHNIREKKGGKVKVHTGPLLADVFKKQLVVRDIDRRCSRGSSGRGGKSGTNGMTQPHEIQHDPLHCNTSI